MSPIPGKAVSDEILVLPVNSPYIIPPHSLDKSEIIRYNKRNKL